jgi:hypothetical protein
MRYKTIWGGAKLEEITVSKEFRNVCYEIMDGSYESLSKLDAFEEYPHQVEAVKAAVAFFDMDYEKAIELTTALMPYWSEWHYSNVGNEYMAALVFAARETGKTDFVRNAIQKEQERLLAEDKEKCESGKHQRYNYCGLMLKYLDTGIMPKSDECNYQVPEGAKSVEEIIKEKKIKNKTVADKMKLYNLVCAKGYPNDAVEIYEELTSESLSEMQHENAIVRYLYLNQEEKAIQGIERLATARLWTVASPTQVRPMIFFTHPMMHKFLRDKDTLERIKKAGFIDNGTVKRQ